MIVTEFFDMVPLWGLFLASFMVIFLSIEFGFLMGKRRRGRLTGDEKLYIGPVVTASLTLLAFMLAFVFGAVESRYNETKHIALDEANAIGTAFLRADLLPEADRAEVRLLLQDYVTLLMEVTQHSTKQQIERVVERSEEMQNDLWSRAVTLADQQPTPISALFVQSLNDMIDMHEKRVTFTSVRLRIEQIQLVI